MVNVLAITKRELNTYFLSPIAYIVLTAFALADGIMFVLWVRPPLDPDQVARVAFSVPMVLLIFAVPLLTMRLLSDEAYRGTIETLMTAPVTELEVVAGKFVGALIFTVIMFVPILAEVLFLRLLGEMDAGPLLSGFLGVFLLAAQFVAIGLFCSALTRIQVASAIICFVILLGFYLIPLLFTDSAALSVRVLRYISPPTHYVGFLKGIVDTRDLAYLVVTTAAFLFLTVKALELRKWR
jgi:ABC-2 type transport system permease protein